MSCAFCSGSHSTEECLLKKTAYCSYCCKKGHFTVKCKYHVILGDSVKCMKSTPSSIPKEALVITREDKAIRAFLLFHKLSACLKMENNIRNLKKYCKETGQRLVWVEIPQV